MNLHLLSLFIEEIFFKCLLHARHCIYGSEENRFLAPVEVTVYVEMNMIQILMQINP